MLHLTCPSSGTRYDPGVSAKLPVRANKKLTAAQQAALDDLKAKGVEMHMASMPT